MKNSQYIHDLNNLKHQLEVLKTEIMDLECDDIELFKGYNNVLMEKNKEIKKFKNNRIRRFTK